MIEEKSDGRIKVEVYPAQQLGSAQEMIEGMQMGTIEATLLPTAKFGGFDQTMNILDMPFLFPDEDTLYEIMNGELGEQVMAGLPDIGIRGCAFYGNGFKAITNNIHPIESPDDLKGLKIRTMENPVDVGIFNAIGAQATPMAYSELFTAIQQGTVDGGENTIANYLSDGFSEVAPYLTLSGHTYNICIILISNEAIEKIPADMRDAFFAACKDGIAQASAMVLQANEDAIETLKANGATITD